jgi:hypothetical protein
MAHASGGKAEAVGLIAPAETRPQRPASEITGVAVGDMAGD